MDKIYPLISCIMPTYNRRAFVPHAIRYFLRQDYPNKELIVIDDGTDKIEDLLPQTDNIRYYRLDKKISLGAKMNLACKYAKGNIITNWDDDDWYSDWRLSYQMNAMKQQNISVCGINKLLYYDLENCKGYQYIYPPNLKIWLLGSSLCFTRKLWEQIAFEDINVGMDGKFVWATPSDQVKALEDFTYAVHMIHGSNISPKNTRGGYWHSYPVDEIANLMGEDWKHYNNCFWEGTTIKVSKQIKTQSSKKCEKRLLKNIYACLVHEKVDCIIDLVQNLHYNDPDSVILLYNGSEFPDLLKINFPFEKYNTLVHPSPVPQKHGCLHKFALDCMDYAVQSFSFDLFTIVDSDQLSIRSGFSKYIGEYISNLSNVGLLSNNPNQFLSDNINNKVTAQAFKEYDLWKPLLEQFQDSNKKFVHWTFWPSAVFTLNAVKDLVNLFKKNEALQKIMAKTKIWATEEVILPTLVRLLGYNIAANPCSFEYVTYKQKFSHQDVVSAFNTNNAYWIHPIERKYNNALRLFIRNKLNDYKTKKRKPVKDINLGLLILHYNTPELTEALCRMTGPGTIVIDNGSDKNKRYQGKNECIRFDRNWGFTIGWNKAIKKLFNRFDAFWLMNSDIEITQKSIDRVRKLLGEKSCIGMITPSFNCWMKNCNNYGTGEIRQVKCLELTAPVIRKTVFENVGFFDERFSLGYGVDFDFAIRVNKAGFKMFVDDGSSFIHQQSQTIKSLPEVNMYYRKATNELESGMHDKYGPSWRTIVKNEMNLNYGKKMKTAVYTTIFDNYANLWPLPRQTKEVDFYCITDNPKLKVDGCYTVNPDFPRADLHPRLRAKFFKMFPWECDLLKAYENLIYVDGSIEIKSNDFVKYCLDNLKGDILLFRHPDRNCIYDEVKASIGLNKYKNEKLELQEKAYRQFHPAKAGLFACGIIARKNNDKIKSLMSAWWWENIKYSYQDQISFPVVCRLFGITPNTFPDRQYPNHRFNIHWHDDHILDTVVKITDRTITSSART